MPFGMIQWSPDTGNGKHFGGYDFADHRISDFSVDHISGAGCPYGGDFALMPITEKMPFSPPKNRRSFEQPFSHALEVVKPGYYGVAFSNGMKVELTTTTRTGFGRFAYPAHCPETLMINASSDINGSSASHISINPATHEVSGWSIGGHFCNTPTDRREQRVVYFYAVFNRPFQSWSAWSDKTLSPGATNGFGLNSGAYISFSPGNDQAVLLKIGISYVSIANAQANVMAENSASDFASKDFQKAVKNAGNTWNGWLNKIQAIGGTLDEKRTFYSMLYHTLLGPVVVSDVNGQYLGYDEKVHSTTDGRVQYGIFSGWDIYRSECQLLAMIAPEEASDMAQSLLMDYQQGGTFPRWGLVTQDTGVMMGDPAAVMISDFYSFGARHFDTNAALTGLMLAATNPSVCSPSTGIKERDALEDYVKLGYVPEHQEGGYGNVAMTLEYCSADFALSQLAQSLGDTADAAMLQHRAQNWKNLYNTNTGCIQMRRRDGSWSPGFTNNLEQYDGDRAYVEGTAGQYTWMVPFNLKGLTDLMGGQVSAASRLDDFFGILNAGFRGPNSWMAWMGNEPCLGTPWIYDFTGQPWKTQATVRRAMIELYSPDPAAYPGNDDVGEMSSWYVFSALGIYPELPGSDILTLGSPLFSKVTLHLLEGDVTIIGKCAAREAPYVQSLSVNGQKWSKPWIRYQTISRGGILIFDLGTTINTNWGCNSADAPPSYDDGK